MVMTIFDRRKAVYVKIEDLSVRLTMLLVGCHYCITPFYLMVYRLECYNSYAFLIVCIVTLKDGVQVVPTPEPHFILNLNV